MTLPAESLPEVIAGRYRLGRCLGEGASGTVHEAENLAIGRRVAVKLLHPYHADHEGWRERFEDEARAAATIGHPNIIDVLDMGRTGADVPYIVMELLEGEGLYERMKTTGAMSPPRAVEIALQVLSGLDAVHRHGIVHRDIKPENLFLARRGDGTEVVKILDFGIARIEKRETRATAGGMVVGTPAYMSAEQARGGELDGRTDLYAVGVLLYELLTGRLPYEGDLELGIPSLLEADPEPLESLAPWVPVGLAEVVRTAMARDPADRFPHAGAMVAALRPFRGTSVRSATVTLVLPVAAPAAAAPRPMKRRLVGRTGWRLLAAVAALGAVGAALDPDELVHPAAPLPPLVVEAPAPPPAPPAILAVFPGPAAPALAAEPTAAAAVPAARAPRPIRRPRPPFVHVY